MPVWKWLAGRPQPVGAGRWQPFDLVDIAGGQPDAFGHMGTPIRIIEALAGTAIEHTARNIGGDQLACILIFELVKTAFAATVAQSLPLAAIERLERPLPKPVRSYFTHVSSNLETATLSSAGVITAIGLPSGPNR